MKTYRKSASPEVCWTGESSNEQEWNYDCAYCQQFLLDIFNKIKLDEKQAHNDTFIWQEINLQILYVKCF